MDGGGVQMVPGTNGANIRHSLHSCASDQPSSPRAPHARSLSGPKIVFKWSAACGDHSVGASTASAGVCQWANGEAIIIESRFRAASRLANGQFYCQQPHRSAWKLEKSVNRRRADISTKGWPHH